MNEALVSTNKNYDALESGGIVQAIQCFKCKTMYTLNTNNCLTVHGNLCVGVSGGIIGNNLDTEGKVVNFTAICRFCLIEMLNKL